MTTSACTCNMGRMNRTELTIRVEKAKLIETLKENAAKHKEDYETAKAGFRIVLREELQQKLAQLDAGEKVELRINQQKPQSYYPEYLDIIDMLEWDESESVELSRSDFQAWVKDDWDWKNGWSITNTAYLSAGAAAPR